MNNDNDSRTLYVNALDALLKGEIAKVVQERDFMLLKEIARLAEQDAPVDLAATDPSLYMSWRAAVTRYHLSGWTKMTPERVSKIMQSLDSGE
ncbi:MAG: hypothetical protein GXP18_12820 [Gammaproteobacteria bacterium]|nr:hypothetical protein [Gammaproteobacteria bacterium]